GKAQLVYKGREALRLALRASGLKNATVAISGFTCFAVYDAIVKEGFIPEYLDIEKDLNFSLTTVKKHLEKNSQIKILVIQNTLGYPCNIKGIAKFCQEKKIILIEDLAHSIGTIYENDLEAGTVGDFVALSFSQDKMIDGISGGALIIRNKKYSLGNLELPTIEKQKQIVDRLYPLFTFLIRKTYVLGLGKLIHVFLKIFKLLSNPMSDSFEIHTLPAWYSTLIYHEFINLEKNLIHRRKIATVYASRLNKNLIALEIGKNISSSSNIRFPIFAEKRNDLIKFLRDNNIYVSDIWYDAPIAPKKYLSKTNYKNQCPESEKIAERILNLPTHCNVSEQHAIKIAEKINQWLTI
ncbi:MAG TPA: DegT/DnrJ/EryC1/StrS family aminotransferase, partial [Patescibacteria group bacterium]